MTIASTKTNATGIQSGADTHHHDQSMLLVSLRTMKIRNRTIPKPIPPDEFESFAISLSFYVLKG